MDEKMNPEVKAKWLAALRSGEYKQATSQLRTEGGHCCLGVLCEIHHQSTQEGHWEGDRYVVGVSERGLNLSTPVMKWASLTSSEPRIPINAEIRKRIPRLELKWPDVSVAYLNDNGFTFAEIADLIEAHL